MISSKCHWINYKAGVLHNLKAAVILAGLNSMVILKLKKKKLEIILKICFKNTQSIKIKKVKKKLLKLWKKIFKSY